MPHTPHTLRPGARVSVIAPAGPFDPQVFEAGLRVLRGRYEVVHSDAILQRSRYLAGADDARLADLVRAFEDRSTHAIFCARGGYGVMRLLPRLDPSRLPAKALVGFSDITALHLAWQTRGRVTFHGPVVTQLGRLPPADVQRMIETLESTAPAAPVYGTETYVPGAVEGPLVGGNLSVLSRLVGTPYLPDLTGAVLLLEDVGEKPYRLDRMWTHLALAGVFQRVAGVALGEFTGCDEPAEPAHTSGEILRELAAASGVPCVAGFPIGHGSVNATVPLGVRVRLDGATRSLTFLEPHARAEAVA